MANTLQEKYDKLLLELENIKQILEVYPDAKIYNDRWNNKRYSDKKVNTIVNHVEFRHSCGCCSDSALLAYPCIMFGNTRIYSDPMYFCIGEKCPDGGERSLPGWRKAMEEKLIPLQIIEEVRQYLKENPPCNVYNKEYDEFNIDPNYEPEE